MLIGTKIRLRNKRLDDVRNDYTWQSDSGLARLDAAPRLFTTFSQYLSIYATELHHSAPAKRIFAIETLDGKHIGNCSFYNINKTEDEAELGILIGNRDYWDKGYGTDAVTTLVNYIFRQTSLKRIQLKTLDSNRRAEKCFQKCGFTPYGHLNKEGHSFVLMELHRKQREEQQLKEKGNGAK